MCVRSLVRARACVRAYNVDNVTMLNGENIPLRRQQTVKTSTKETMLNADNSSIKLKHQTKETVLNGDCQTVTSCDITSSTNLFISVGIASLTSSS